VRLAHLGDVGAADEAKAMASRREELMQARRVEDWRLTLKAHEALALFSRELTVLDVDAPVDLPWEDLPVGGFEVDELKALYTKHGFTRKAAEVPSFPKRAPWRLPWMATEEATSHVQNERASEGAPAPRRIDGRADAHAGRAADAGDGGADTDRDEPVTDPLDRDIVEVRVRNAIRKGDVLVLKYLAEDIQKGEKYRLRPEDAAGFVAQLRAKGVAA
jgi:hypothetical protein